MRTRAATAATSSTSCSPSATSSALDAGRIAATRSSSRCCTTSARSASRPRSSTSPASSTPRSARSCETHTIEGEEMLERVGGLLGRRRAHRPLVPRALGRRRLPGRARRRGDPARRADRLRLRRVQRHDDRSPYRTARARGEAIDEMVRCAGNAVRPGRRRGARARRRLDAPPHVTRTSESRAGCPGRGIRSSAGGPSMLGTGHCGERKRYAFDSAAGIAGWRALRCDRVRGEHVRARGGRRQPAHGHRPPDGRPAQETGRPAGEGTLCEGRQALGGRRLRPWRIGAGLFGLG